MKNKKYSALVGGIFAGLIFALLPILTQAQVQTVSGEVSGSKVIGTGGTQTVQVRHYSAPLMKNCVVGQLSGMGYSENDIKNNLPIFYAVVPQYGPLQGQSCGDAPSKTGDIIADAKAIIRAINNTEDFRKDEMLAFVDQGIQNKNQMNCSQKNQYNYTFSYEVFRDNAWGVLPNVNVNKCEQVRLNFSPVAEWFGSFDLIPGSFNIQYYDSPPTAFLACSDQNNCLNQSTEYQLTPETWGRGVQQVPANWIETTQNSVTSNNNPYFTCTSGICIPYVSGTYTLSATAAAGTYYGQCRRNEGTINLDGIAVPAVTSTQNLAVQNQAPAVSVTLDKTEVKANDQITATCNVVDPDSCVDKIARIKWTCYNSDNQKVDCFFNQDGVWKEGGANFDIPTASQSNPYQTTINLKATKDGAYAVSCEAWDNDANNPMNGIGFTGLKVNPDHCGQDNYCDPNCNPQDPDCNHCGQDGVCMPGCNPKDPDCSCGADNICIPNCTPQDPDCVVAASLKFCAILPDSGESDKTVCNNSANIDYKIHSFGLVNPDQYMWKCSANDTEKSGTDKITCPYSAPGTYAPELRIHDTDGNQWIACAQDASTKITSNSQCSIGVRKAGSSDDYTNSLTIQTGDTVEAKIQRECLDNGTTTWNSNNGTQQSGSDNNNAKFKFDNGGAGTISASIDKNGSKTQCSGANITIKEKVQQGQ